MEKIFFDDAMNVIEGGAAGALGYLGGSFMAGVSTSIGFTQLGSLPLGILVGGLFFLGTALPRMRANHRLDDEEIKGGGSKYLQYVKVEEIGRKIEVEYEKSKYYAVNEILLRNIQEEVYFKLYYDEKGKRNKLYEYTLSGDGFLVTSAIGSTAYNRTAGGPIILDKDTLCLTFLSIENPLTNSVILRKDEKLHIEIEKGRGMLSHDGVVISELNPGKSFDIKLSNKKVKILKLNNKNEEFSEKLSRIIKSKMN